MRREPLVSGPNELLVPLGLVRALLVSAAQDDRLTLRIKGKGEAPQAVEPETKLLHVLKLRAVQPIHVRPAQVGPEFREQPEPRQKLVLDRDREPLKLGLEVVMEGDRERHPLKNALPPIWFQGHILRRDCGVTCQRSVDLTVRAGRHAVSGYASPCASRRHQQEHRPPQ